MHTNRTPVLLAVADTSNTTTSVCAPRFLKYCRKKGGYRGYQYEENESEEDEALAAELHSLNLNGQPAGKTGWRSCSLAVFISGGESLDMYFF